MVKVTQSAARRTDCRGARDGAVVVTRGAMKEAQTRRGVGWGVGVGVGVE